MPYKNTIRRLEEYGLKLDESCPAALNRMARAYKKESGLARLDDIYRLMGTSKQEIFWWKEHLCNTQSKNTHKLRVIDAAAELFSLNEREAKELANKAGLSLRVETGFSVYLRSLLEKHSSKQVKLYSAAQISERMYYHIKNGVIPSKETLSAMLISMNFDVCEIQHVLAKGGYILSNSLPNDAVILWLLKNLDCDQNRLPKINDVLHELGLPLLMTRSKNGKSQD